MAQVKLHPVQWYEPPQKNIIVNYFRTTGIHGLQYLGQPKLHLVERLIWFAAFIIATAVGTALISQMWERYTTLPIVTVLNPIELSLKEIPFPAVTICNVNDITRTKSVEYIQKLMEVEQANATESEIVHAYANGLALKRICETAKRFSTAFYDKKTTEHVLTNFLGEEIARKIVDIRNNPYAQQIYNLSDPIKMIMEDSQQCDKMILLCIWLNEVHNCSELFQQISTDFGVCCTFNMMPKSLLRRFSEENIPENEVASDWKDSHLSMEKLIFTEQTKDRKYPRRQLHAGRTSGLSFLLDPDLEEYFCPNLDSEGFVLSLHSPLDIPRMRENGNVIGAHSEVFVGVKPEITIADESIVSFEPNKRHCYFHKEMRLAHFTKYSESNCIDECVANLTKARCSCIEFFMPHGPSDSLCTSDDVNCTDSVTQNITRVGLGQACDICLPTCTEIQFETDTTTQNIRRLSGEQLLIKYPQFNSTDFSQITIVHIYFTEDGVYPRLRKEQFGVVDLLSNSGGLLGLCLGFSGLSLLEFIYHFTVRVFFKHYRNRLVGPDTDHTHQTDKGNEDINADLKKFSNNTHENMTDVRTKNYANDNLFNIINKSNTNRIPNTYKTLFESDFKRRIF